jgi:hypothetical protein
MGNKCGHEAMKMAFLFLHSDFDPRVAQDAKHTQKRGRSEEKTSPMLRGTLFDGGSLLFSNGRD